MYIYNNKCGLLKTKNKLNISRINFKNLENYTFEIS